MKRKFINFQKDNFLTFNEKMTTIVQRLKKRQRMINDQPEEEILQNQDQQCNLIPQQIGTLFEEECQEKLRARGITCTLSSASKWQKKGQDHHKESRKYITKFSKEDQDFELIIQEDHGIDAYGHSKDRIYIV